MGIILFVCFSLSVIISVFGVYFMHRLKLNPEISVSIVFVATMFMSIMDSTIVNVALPSLGRQLGVSNTSIDAVVVGYLVSLAVVIPASGWLGDRFGTKRIFLLALALFSISSALCGLAQNFTDRKSTRLNSSHPSISYAVFCLKKKIKTQLHD